MPNVPGVNVDYTHVDRHLSGIERITIEQFSNQALASVRLRTLRAYNRRPSIIAAQMIGLPLHAVRNPADVYIFPGFPPSPYFSLLRDRSVLYVHDLFLLTRKADLNLAARCYMAPTFALAVRNFRYFLTNSLDTATKLRAFCDPTATIIPYRPRIRNVFGLSAGERRQRPADPRKLQIVSIGTVEPRKNLIGAADICDALSRRLGREVELHIIGRLGWGKCIHSLRQRPNVFLHGFLDDAAARTVIESSDLLLCASHDEGLGLPLLEGQFSGIPVVAPNTGVFREALGKSGILVDPSTPEYAASKIADAISLSDWRVQYTISAENNLGRWNENAEKDRIKVTSFIAELASQAERKQIGAMGLFGGVRAPLNLVRRVQRSLVPSSKTRVNP